MPAITVKNIPPKLYEELKTAAQTHRRSLNSEIIACLEHAFLARRVTPEERLNRARALRLQIGASPIQAEEIERAIATGRP